MRFTLSVLSLTSVLLLSGCGLLSTPSDPNALTVQTAQGNVNLSGKNVVVVSKDTRSPEGAAIWAGDLSKLQGGPADVTYLLLPGGATATEIQARADELRTAVTSAGLSSVNVVVASAPPAPDSALGKLLDQWGTDLRDVKTSWNGGSLQVIALGDSGIGKSFTGTVALDAVLYGNDACGDKAPVNDVAGKAAVILRGTCGFTDKVKAATKRGAAAVMLINNDSPLGVIRGACDDTCKSAILALLPNKEGTQLVGALQNGKTARVEVTNLRVLPSVLRISPDGTATDTGPIPYVFNSYLEEDGVKPVDPFSSVRKEGEYLSWETALKTRLQNEDKSGKVTVVPVFKSQLAKDPSWRKEMIYADVTLPANFAQFDTLELDRALACDAARKSACPPWDYETNLYICDPLDLTKCNQELARDITPYWNSGRWVTDISPLLAVLREKAVNGKVRLAYWTVQPYKVTMNLRFQNKGNALIPVWAAPLKFGGVFGDGAYNTRQAPVTFERPAWAKKVEFSTLVTGHGFNDSKSCAEFCNTVHHVTVNGNDFTLSSPVTDNPLGCFEQVKDGVVPNQSGTWVYGRNNWCPGQGVKLWNSDLSAAATGPGPHTLTYKALVDGQDHLSKLEDGAERDASIHMTSWLVYYAERGAALPSKPNVKQ